jgi:murein DD-endopeptidase MepM/ murein hydrolase activator NlpD
MKRVLAMVMFCVLTGSLNVQAASDASQPASKPPEPSFPPPQLELRVPFEPTAFPSAGRTYLAYELHLANYSGQPLTIGRIEVLDANALVEKPIATFTSEQLGMMLQTFAPRSPSAAPNAAEVAGGTTVVAFMWVPFEAGTAVPAKLRHRVLASDSPVEGATIGTHHSKLRILGPPLEGSNWVAADGPSNDADNHHRRGLVVLDAAPVISRRYAFDWQQREGGAAFSGDGREVRAYYSYGKPVLAVANGIVIAARNDLPDNRPGHGKDFVAAVPTTYETIGGNTVTLDIGDGQYAYYFHMQPGSVRVKTGDRVRRGQVLGQVGCSGDAREPHLHFEVTTSPRPLVGEGVPYVIEAYRTKVGEGSSQTHTRELPLRNMIVDFPR